MQAYSTTCCVVKFSNNRHLVHYNTAHVHTSHNMPVSRGPDLYPLLITLQQCGSPHACLIHAKHSLLRLTGNKKKSTLQKRLPGCYKPVVCLPTLQRSVEALMRVSSMPDGSWELMFSSSLVSKGNKTWDREKGLCGHFQSTKKGNRPTLMLARGRSEHGTLPIPNCRESHVNKTASVCHSKLYITKMI